MNQQAVLDEFPKLHVTSARSPAFVGARSSDPPRDVGSHLLPEVREKELVQVGAPKAGEWVADEEKLQVVLLLPLHSPPAHAVRVGVVVYLQFSSIKKTNCNHPTRGSFVVVMAGS